MSRHKTGYVISYHGILCHDMSYVTTIAASLIAIAIFSYCSYSQLCDKHVMIHRNDMHGCSPQVSMVTYSNF